jgi:hypothetical protein
MKGKGLDFLECLKRVNIMCKTKLVAIFWFKVDGGGRIKWVGFISIEIEVDSISMEMSGTGWKWNKICKMTILG